MIEDDGEISGFYSDAEGSVDDGNSILNPCIAHGIEVQGKAHNDLVKKSIMPNGLENYNVLHDAGEDNEADQYTEEEDPCCYNTPSFTPEKVATLSPSPCLLHTLSENKERTEGPSQEPACLLSSETSCPDSEVKNKMVLQGTSLVHNKARKLRRKHHLKTHDKPIMRGVPAIEQSRELPVCLLYPGFFSLSEEMASVEVKFSVESKDWLLHNKETIPKSSTFMKGKPMQLTKEDTSQSDVLGERKACIDMDVDKSRSEDMCKHDILAGYVSKEDGVLDNHHAQKQELDVYSMSDANRKGLGMDPKNPFSNKIEAEQIEIREANMSEQPTHFLVWLATLIIHALGYLLKFMLRLPIRLISVCYHSYLFALNVFDYILQAKVKATETDTKVYNDTANLDLGITERVSTMQPTIATGAKRLACGCLTATYAVMILSFLFISAFIFSFFVVKGFVYEPVQMNRDLYFDYTKRLPVASIDFSSSKMYPEADSMLKRMLLPARRFRATVLLILPESDFNKKLGIFQVTAELLSVTGQVLVSTTQPCMLRFRSTMLQHIKSVLMAIPLLTGLYSETQTLSVTLEWQEKRAFSSASVRVVLAPRAGRPLLTGLPELYGAEIHVNSEISWWLSIIGGWRWTLSVWIGLIVFVGEVVFILCLCRQFLLPDLGILLSTVSTSVRQRDFHKVKAACLGQKLISKAALEVMSTSSEHSDLVSEDVGFVKS